MHRRPRRLRLCPKLRRAADRASQPDARGCASTGQVISRTQRRRFPRQPDHPRCRLADGPRRLGFPITVQIPALVTPSLTASDRCEPTRRSCPASDDARWLHQTRDERLCHRGWPPEFYLQLCNIIRRSLWHSLRHPSILCRHRHISEVLGGPARAPHGQFLSLGRSRVVAASTSRPRFRGSRKRNADPGSCRREPAHR